MDALFLFSCIKDGLRKSVKAAPEGISGIAIDTWGVDFGLLDKQGKLVSNPFAYRDKRGLRGRNAFLKISESVQLLTSQALRALKSTLYTSL